MKLEPVLKHSLVDTVVSRIRGLIDQERLEAGDRLPGELELVEQLQVSRPVLREAISRLESVGVVTVRRGQGMFVGDRGSLSSCIKLVRTAMAISPKDVEKFAELRTAIECHAARRAADLASSDDLAELEELLDQMDQPGTHHLEAIRIDFQFHRKVVDIIRNEVMSNIMEVIHEFVMAGMVHTTPKPRDHVQSRTLHSAVLHAIRNRDPDAAENAMKVHMDATTQALRAAEERQKHKRRAVNS